jgi:excisionase family DNA binding protein
MSDAQIKSADDWMRKDETASHYQVSERTITNWQRQGKIPFYRLGRKLVLFKRSEIDAALARFRVKSVGEPTLPEGQNSKGRSS